MSAPSEAVTALARVLPEHRVDDAAQMLDRAAFETLASIAAPLSAWVTKAKALAAVAPKTENENAAVVACLTDGRGALKQLEDLRKKAVGPLNEQVKDINALFASVAGPIEGLAEKKGPLERVNLAWVAAERSRVQREQDEARRKQEEAARAEAAAIAEAEAAKTETARKEALAKAETASRAQAQAFVEAPRAVPKGTKTETGSATVVDRWVLQGITDLNAVPRSYWTHPDVVAALEKVLRAAVKAGARRISGCAIGLEDALLVRTGR